ncbi:MAG: hypothetical protein C0511_00210 [Hyphomicrobium sp.]|nr:hypothetical protein [Hyphomicrobium sp.]PPC84286.1 MAG: hypothetical protein CTY40_00210 [Hyphomicrobium sp.]PPD26130.1 MAG: hypothetical protein CTY20_14865 [Hyphomicrobium sp.]
MTDTNYPMTADGGPDDLPRTLRRERDAREREARERMAKEQRESFAPHTGPGIADPFAGTDAGYANVPGEPLPAVVRSFDVPFLQLVGFFMKAVFAMVPALILLGVILWGLGQLLQNFFPQLVKMQILIWFPN